MEETKEAPKVEETKEGAQAQNAQPQPTTEPQETPQQIDWKRFKEARKKEREQKEEAERRAAQSSKEAEALKAAMEALVNRPNPVQTGEVEETEDDRIQKKIDKALADERKRVEDERTRREQTEFPQRVLAVHPDFDNVCTTENLDYLEFHYPEVARAFKKAPDSFDKWSDVYKAIKRFVPNNSNNKDGKSAEKNFKKPQSMSVGGTTQTGDHAPMMLDEKRKQDNWSRMQKRMKGIA